MAKRTIQLTVRFTPDKYNELKEKAAIAGLKMEPFVRGLIDGCAIKPRPPESYVELRRDLAAIGNNINQIAYVANLSKNVKAEQIQQVQDLMNRVWELFLEKM